VKYLCLAYYDEQAFEALPKPELDAIVSQCPRYDADLRASGHLVLQASLGASRASVSVRPRQGRPVVTDGPFAETKEQLGGFYMIDVPNLDDAIEAAARCPGATRGTIEIRPIMEFESPEA
jgi:hypothetical protein